MTPPETTAHTESHSTEAQPSRLRQDEVWWSGHYKWLENCGYLLRPRYKPDWIPSWQGTSNSPFLCEDGIKPRYASVLDATRISDGEFVMFKAVLRNDHPYEVEVARYLVSEPLQSDPMNHCVPILDVLRPPDEEYDIIVMPLLRRYSDPSFETFGEAVECFRQLFEGLYFMHKHHVAHRDCMNLNIMMDPKPLFIDAFHPFRSRRTRDLKGDARHYSRTQRPTKYFLIDFGLSRRYDPSVTNPLEPVILGGDKTVPEFKSLKPQNPFPTDVYYIGHAIQETFLDEYNGFDFIEPLILDMVQENPSLRPTMEQVIGRLAIICQGLSTRKLRSRLTAKQEGRFQSLLKDIDHWQRQFLFIIRRLPAIPRPRE
ncbi:hypothetical protein DEU56DRAFT_806636 [Suillus clintonianus]|uniref:uncharacterized protein n=1 Tax=Suillus clintonianus TaxID=1904413 RepID=UPI001B87F6FA|nr:uncharacterized protein DEU56DRAFT_806636 [Suillus clintonianus]KAG2135809.1 hypothetical protein DEU56DRAFT_806636 [Suillus clintonianus]